MPFSPVVISPALPSELLSYLVNNCVYPTTLVICSPRADFLARLTGDVRQQLEPVYGHANESYTENLAHDEQAQHSSHHPLGAAAAATASRLLQAPLYQVAVARHIRTVFVPTVSHLRAFLSIFSPGDESRVPPPPPPGGPPSRPGPPPKTPLLMAYGFLDLHRDTSEWSAQGVGGTAAGLVEAARRVAFQAVIVEPRREDGGDYLAEAMPVLSGSARRMRPDMEGAGWTGRTVEVRRVLGRWFHFRESSWESHEGLLTNQSVADVG